MFNFLFGKKPNYLEIVSAFTIGATLALLIVASTPFTLIQKILIFFLFLDVAAGSVTNLTSSTRDYYDSLGNRYKYLVLVLHVFHPFIFFSIFGIDLFWALVVFAYMLIASLITINIKTVLQRSSVAHAFNFILIGITLFAVTQED